MNADHPENLIFGIALQYYDDEMPDLSFINPDQLRVIKWHPDERPGVVRVRYEISQLVKDEDYFLSIDSHSLFEPGWDTTCLEWIKELQDKTGNHDVCVTNAALTGDGKQMKRQASVRLMKGMSFIPAQVYIGPSKIVDGWQDAANLSCNFFFAPMTIIKNVGWDPYSQFSWEEQYMFFRAFMSGFDCFVPETKTAIRQSSEFYYYYVWPDISKHAWTRKDNQDSAEHDYELQLAMILNKPENKFSIKNPKRTTREFWERLNQAESYDNYAVYDE